MNPFLIGLAIGLTPLISVMIFLRLAPKPKERDLMSANELLQQRNSIGSASVNALTEISDSLREISATLNPKIK